MSTTIKVRCEVKEYPQITARECNNFLIVKSHWNEDFVILEIDGVERKYLAKDLIKAINNATNHMSW